MPFLMPALDLLPAPGARPPLVMTGSYDAHLVALSVCIAILASYTALDLAGRVTAARGRMRAVWLSGGAVAMGLGIWSMHFVGMLAFHLAAPVAYDLPTVLVSLLVAILVAGLALFIVSRRSLGLVNWLGGGALMGLGIGAMHYSGMAALRLPLTLRYAPVPFALSLAIAVGASLAAVGIAFHLRTGQRRRLLLGSAVVMGAAIAGMHYTGMAAAHFTMGGTMTEGAVASAPSGGGTFLLAVAIALATLIVLGFALLASLVDQRLAARAAEAAALRDSEERLRVLGEQLRQQLEFTRTIMHSLGDGVCAFDSAGRLTALNPAAESLLGVRADALRGAALPDVIRLQRIADAPDATGDAAEDADSALWRAVQAGHTLHSDEEALARPDGRQVPVAYTASPIVTNKGVTGAVLVVRDITESRRLRDDLRYQASHDALTDLPNRARLHAHLAAALAAARRAGTPLALLLLDLDRFKEVNDTLGHQAGDVLLQEVAARLRTALRGTDTVARLGGDEFAVVLPATDAAGAATVARALIAAIEAPFVVEGQTLAVGASVGVALHPAHGQEAEALLRCADVAMYAAKHGALGQALYNPAQQGSDGGRLTLLAELRQALAAGALALHYQPKVHVSSGRIVGVEALVRWPHPERGLIPPDRFIPLAEQTGLIVPLTAWVLDEALRQCAAWAADGLTLAVAVNLSLRNLRDPELVAMVAAALARHGVPPERLCLELTESVVMADAEGTRATLERLADLGVRLAIDDFGTGYSSLAYLSRLPVDELKIDRAFVRQMTTQANDHVIVASTIGLGHSLGMSVVTEGVENDQTWAALGQLGCDVGQGYYLSRPLPAEAIPAWLRRAEQNKDWTDDGTGGLVGRRASA